MIWRSPSGRASYITPDGIFTCNSVLNSTTMMTAVLVGLIGCSGGNEPGHYWEITAVGVNDTCNGALDAVEDSFTYRLQFDETNVAVAVGPDVFASGEVNGCNVDDESVAWTDDRPGGELTWQIRGSAVAQFGDGACGMSDTDWRGTEAFEIITSADPNISAGCVFEMELTGKYLHELP